MILVYGTVCLDRLRRVATWPKPGGYVEIESDEPFLGGEAANTASHLARWGAEVVLTGNRLGEGEAETMLRQALKKAGISDDRLQSGGRTPICDIYVTPDGERTMIGRGFSAMEASSVIPYQAGSWFTVDPNMGDRARAAAADAAKAGMHTYLMDFFQETDQVAPNSYWQSSTDWVGERANPEANVEWVTNWVAKHNCYAILTDGPHGYAAAGPGIPARWHDARPAKHVVDATGAGDAFRAGMLYGLSQGWPFEKCLPFASASGALKCAWLGGTSANHTVEDCLAYN